MKKTIAIIGGGSSALMLGCVLDSKKFDIRIYEKNNAPGRKFLVAGDGGLNLTHSENKEKFISRYTPAVFLEGAFTHFSNTDFIHWINELGIKTYVGSSGRIFPEKNMKPIEVLSAFLEKIKNNSVSIHTKHEWKGFSSSNELMFEREKTIIKEKADLVIFCLGGASWPVTGSAGDWLSFFTEKNIVTKPFEASNCYFETGWPAALIDTIEGKALKNCRISCGSSFVDGEVVITKKGLEGSGIYPLSPQIREQLAKQGSADIYIDLKPGSDSASLLNKLKKSRSSGSYSEHLARQLNLNPVHLRLLKTLVSKEEFLNPEKVLHHIKGLHLSINGLGPIEDAISTVGGISLDEITKNFELKKMSGTFVIGEMLDYDAPTGGYLLQSCFSMAKYLGDYLNSEI